MYVKQESLDYPVDPAQAGAGPARSDLPPARSPRKQARSQATRAQLLAAARTLFGSRGYADTATDDVVRAAGVTRGALYHHFANKKALFRAVFEQIKQEQSEAICSALLSDDPWQALLAACQTMIDLNLDPAVQQIVLRDARAVLC